MGCETAAVFATLRFGVEFSFPQLVVVAALKRIAGSVNKNIKQSSHPLRGTPPLEGNGYVFIRSSFIVRS